MDVSQPSLSENAALSNAAPGLESDTGPIHRAAPSRLAPLAAILFGILLAVLVASFLNARSARAHVASVGAARSLAASAVSARDSHELDRLRPQKQAETLLELAVRNSDGAVDQISSRVDHWQGKLRWSSQISTLTTAALNSSDMRVRESGIEVELAAYGLAKNSSSLEYLLKTANSPDHSQKVWALWALGLMGNRGVQTERIVPVLIAHLKDSDEDSRRWAVQGLALTGSTGAIAPLLASMHDDASPSVRETAACGVAESGMFTREQRFSAIPQLLNYTDDPTLDGQTHAWTFQALTDITHQHLGNDPSAWRSWYESTKTNWKRACPGCENGSISMNF